MNELKKAFAYTVKALEIIPFIILLAYSWYYISLITTSPYTELGKEMYNLQVNQSISFEILLHILKQNIIAIGIFTVVMIVFALYCYHSGSIFGYRNFTISAFEIWLTVIFVFSYISRFMQSCSQTVVFAVLLSMALLMVIVNMVFFIKEEEKYLKKKLYFFLFIALSVVIKYFSNENQLTSFTDELISAFSINFFSVLIIIYYLALKNYDDNLFMTLLAVLFFIIAFPFFFVVFMYAVYSVFYAITAIFSGFRFAGMYDNFFLSHLVNLFNITLLKTYTLNYNGIVAALASLFGVTALIFSFEDESEQKILANMQVKNIVLTVIGITMIIYFAINFSKNHKSTKAKNLVQNNTENSFLKLTGKVNFSNQPLNVFAYHNTCIVVTDNYKAFNIDNKGYIKEQFQFPAYDNLTESTDNDTIALSVSSNKNNFYLYFYDVKNKNVYAEKSFQFYSNDLLTLTAFRYHNQNLLLLTSFNKFYFIDFKTNILWSGKLPDDKVNMNTFSKIRLKLKKDSLYVFSELNNNRFVFDLKNQKVSTFKSLSEIYNLPCWDFRKDSFNTNTIIKIIKPDKAAEIYDTIAGNVHFISPQIYYNSLKLFIINNKQKITVRELNSYQYLFVKAGDFFIGLDKSIVLGNDDKIIIFNREQFYTQKNLNRSDIIQAVYQKPALYIISKENLFVYEVE